MKHRVYLTRHALQDLEEIDDHLMHSDSAARADYVLTKIESLLESLSESPDRGSRPKELLELGIAEYRQLFFKPYRIIYTTKDNDIYVVLIADGRRDMETLLQRRLLTA